MDEAINAIPTENTHDGKVMRVPEGGMEKRQSIKMMKDPVGTSTTPKGEVMTVPEGVDEMNRMSQRPTTGGDDTICNEILCHETLFSRDEITNEGKIEELLSMKAVADPDTMYLHQAMR